MNKSNFWLFLLPALIWSSTWFVITFQLGSVDPLISVVYRFALASVVMMMICWFKGVNMKFTASEHGFIALQGLFLFGINYWLAYAAEMYITSGLMAVAFSTIVFANSIFGYVLLKRPIDRRVIIGALFALSGTFVIFWKELVVLNFSDKTIIGIVIGMSSVVLASLGNIASARNSAAKIPVMQANAFGMLYGTVSMALLAFVLNKDFVFEWTQGYVLSLIYLAVFGSVIAFGTYLTLVGQWGADKAAYTLVVIPVISMGISMVFENYQLSVIAMFGIALIVFGNVLALRKRKV